MHAAPIPQFSDLVLKFGPWSISKAGTAEKCSLQFDFKYGAQKQKELETYQESNIGVAVHLALELALGATPLKAAFQMAGDKYELTDHELEQLESFYEQVGRFVAKMAKFQTKHGVHPAHVMIERRMGIRADFSACSFFEKGGGCSHCQRAVAAHVDGMCVSRVPTPYKEALPVFFRGVVDYAMLTKDKNLIIIDHKSGKEKDLSFFQPQFKSYCLMAQAAIPDLKGIQTAINFVMTDNLVWNPYVKASTIRDEYRPWMVEHLAKSCEKLEGGVSASKGWWCDWCGYKSICPTFAGK